MSGSLNGASLTSERVSSSSNEVIIFGPAVCKKLKGYFELVFNTIVNKYGLTQEQSDDTWTQAIAELQNTLKAILPREVYFGIENGTYDISGLHELIQENLIIITAEFFMVAGNDIIKRIQYIKDRRAQAQYVKDTYDPIANMLVGCELNM